VRDSSTSVEPSAQIFVDSSSWFQRWYLELRLVEEIYRASRYALLSSLIVVKLTQYDLMDDVAIPAPLSQFAEQHLRVSDVPGYLGYGEYAICLPHTDEAGGRVVMSRLNEELRDYSPRVGLAVIPSDGSTPAALIEFAQQRAA
jgi:hypothetical protein